jgi:hypothetical protein
MTVLEVHGSNSNMDSDDLDAISEPESKDSSPRRRIDSIIPCIFTAGVIPSPPFVPQSAVRSTRSSSTWTDPDAVVDARIESDLRLASAPDSSPSPHSDEEHQAQIASTEVGNASVIDTTSAPETLDEIFDKNHPIAQSRRRRMVIFFFILLIFLVTGAVVATMVAVKEDEAASNGDEDSSQDTPSVSLQFQDEYYESIRRLVLGPTPNMVLDPNSPQAQAMEWLAYQDTLYLDSSHLLQRYALVAFYFANGGNLWAALGNASSGWVPNGIGVHECEWIFVDCDPEQEQVVSLRLSGGGIMLTGELATEIGHLSRLNYLSLANSRLEGTIPFQLYQLTDLGK